MILKILKKDFSRKKVITVAVFIFIMLSALLISSGTNMLIDLSNSLDYLFEKSNVPHFVQYHSGEIDQDIINDWTSDMDIVKQQQTSQMINVEGSKIYIGNSKVSEADTVMEMAFVKQNKKFDYLLDLNNEKIEVNDGEIAVPIFYKQKNNLKIGDKLTIKNKQVELTFSIVAFARDAQMNPSIISSKRFVVSDADFDIIKDNFGEIEYLISFQLSDLSDLSYFINAYGSSTLPKKGPAIDYGLFKTLNSLIDGIIAGSVILISLLLNIIALLCLRFIILSTLEEDYREIGVMKAIGIMPKDIKSIYMTKYMVMAAVSTLIGYIASLFMHNIFSKNIMLYSGITPKNIIGKMLPLIATLLIFVIVIVFCMIILRRFNKISAIESIRMGHSGETYKNRKFMSLFKRSKMNANIFLGLRDVALRFKLYAILLVVFIVCTFIMIIPLNFYNTLKSPDFVSYMGIGRCDVLIDIRQSENIVKRFEEIVKYIKSDEDVDKYASFVTCQYKIINSEGYKESLLIETGDFSVFPLKYYNGVAPELDNEIALSYLVATELGKEVGDDIELIIDNDKKTMIVSGIYQDVTNGGRTAKANIEPNHETASWYTVNLKVKGDITEKIKTYKKQFEDAKVTDIEGYFNQTFGNTLEQLGFLIILAIIIVILIALLITSLFLKMLVAKDSSQIAIMRGIGISLKDIQIQYITKSLTVLISGIILGTIISNTVGEYCLSSVLSIMGAASIEFVINPLQAYILCPVVLIITVVITTLASIKNMKSFSISDINVE